MQCLKTILFGAFIASFLFFSTVSKADSVSPRVQKELSAWETVIPIIPEKCGNGKKPEETKPDEAVAITECITALINERVSPFVVYPDLITSMRERAMKNAQAYERGKISNAEYVKRGRNGWTLYLKALEFRINNPSFLEDK